ncbi:MAG: TetR/AcrR family transcriptional regulator [Desulfovibrio sp.]|nr:TetR/AcrR family transcriptional regulator [Desulfovibrio sp.]
MTYETLTPRLNTESRQDQIARAALTLAADGLRAVTISAVAEAVGLVPSALYRHFKSRNEMLRAAFMLLRSMLEDNVQCSAMETNALVGLERFWRRHLGLFRTHGAIPRILFSEDVAGPGSPFRPMLIEGQDHLIAGISRIIAQGQQSGQIRPDVESYDLAVMFLGQILMPAHMFFIRRGEFDIENQVERNWLIFRSMLKMHQPKEP